MMLTRLERETGFEPATNSLEGYDSTTELLPLPTRNLHYLQFVGFTQDLQFVGFTQAKLPAILQDQNRGCGGGRIRTCVDPKVDGFTARCL